MRAAHPIMSGPGFAISGGCDPRFEAVLQTFARSFEERSEVGAAVCVYWRGHVAVDLWGGVADPSSGRSWSRDTIVCMMSVGKGLATLCALMLADRGLLDLSKPVAEYWPEFASAGKADVTVEQLMGGLAGLVFLDDAPRGVVVDWRAMTDALARQAPAWPPGQRGAYHSATYGHLIGELVRRVDGRDLQSFLAQEVTGPLGSDFQYGVRAEDLPRVADLLPNDQSATWTAIAGGAGPLGRAWRILPSDAGFWFNSPTFREILFPSANGHGNARGVARIFAALANGGEIEGLRLLSPGLVERARTVQWAGLCGLTDREFRYGLGFFLNHASNYMGPNPNAFGHPGAGGAVGFADPEANLSFSYSPNLMCAGAGLGERCEALIRATYASLPT